MKRILVLGANGMLGYGVTEYFTAKGYKVKPLIRKDYDIISDPIEKLEEILVSNDIVINCAGVIKPTIKNNSVENVLKINSVFPKNLAKVSKKHSKMCFHITTDCVYTGQKGQYTENDLFDANDLYGISKNGGENAECMILRTSIIGEEKNKSRSLLEWAKSAKGSSVNGFVNHYWNGVTTLYLAEIINKIIEESLYEEKLYHIFSPETVTKYELLKLLNDIYELQLEITPFEADSMVDRSLASVYDLSSKLANKSLSEQISEMKKFFSKTHAKESSFTHE